MRTLATLSMLVVGALVLPAVHAGSEAAPEITDGDDNYPAALDVRKAWWSRTSDTVVAMNIKVEDLLNSGQPLVDGAPGDLDETRYYYTFKFTPSSYGKPVEVRCLIGFLDTSPAHGVWPAGENGISVGTDCRSTPIPEFNNLNAFFVDTSADRLNNIFTITLTQRNNPTPVSLAPGTTFSGLSLETAAGKLSSRTIPFNPNHKDTVYDTASTTKVFV
jgi:hypothetical protein